MKRGAWAIAAAIWIAGAAPAGRAAELQPATLAAWTDYVKQADSRMAEREAKGLPFLWADETPERAARLRSGELIVAPAVGRGTLAVPHGLVHDWVGAVFIPGATIDSLWSVVHDYDSYRRMYRPVVISSRTLACSEQSQEFQMVWQRKVLFVVAAMRGRYRAHDVRLDAHRGYSIAEAVEVREIEDYGHAGERMLPPDTGNGFLWRIRSVARYEERDGGVYLELEAMALTRDVPPSLAWMVNPLMHRLSVNSLTTTLQQTRDAVVDASRMSSSVARAR
jgi:hypothetical protein